MRFSFYCGSFAAAVCVSIPKVKIKNKVKIIPLSTVMSFFPSGFSSFIAVSNVHSFVISTPRYLYFSQHLISCPFSSVKFHRSSSDTHISCFVNVYIQSPFLIFFYNVSFANITRELEPEYVSRRMN